MTEQRYLANGIHKRPSVASMAKEVMKLEKSSKSETCQGCTNCSTTVTNFIEKCFDRLGSGMGNRPWLTIILSLAVCFVCSAGMVLWQVNTDDEAMWTPYGSSFISQRDWILSNFPKDTRYETIILSTREENGNILTADTIRYLLSLHTEATNVTSQGDTSFEELCYEVPKQEDHEIKECATSSLLKLWDFDEDVIENLTDQEVQEAVTKGIVESNDMDPLSQIEGILSGLKYDSNGTVIKARAVMNIWLLRQNGTKKASEQLIDAVALDWEKAFIQQIILDQQSKVPQGLKMDGLSERSFDDGVDDSVQNNFQVMFGGFSLIFVYIAITLGRWNALEQRVVLSLMGMMVIAMSLGASFGFCFYLGLYFSDMHPCLPFLLLGIGVDDMFVIVQAVENLSASERKLPIDQRVGKAMRHAGVSITVTSVTDMAAFLIGSTSSMPILRHFCLFAAMGVFFLYIFAITFFVGCLTLDERRIDARKVCNCQCVAAKPETWKPPTSLIAQTPGKVIFEKGLAPFLANPIVKVLVIVATSIIFAFGVYGVTQIRLDYDSMWFMDQKSYQTSYYKIVKEVFPEHGERVELYIGQVNYTNAQEKLLQIENVLKSSPYVRSDSIQYWYPKFYRDCCLIEATDYCVDYYDIFSEYNCTHEIGFKRRLLLFLQYNPFWYQDMRFNISLEDIEDEMELYETGEFELTASRAKYQHYKLANTTIRTTAMQEIKDSMDQIKFEQPDNIDDPDRFLKVPVPYAYMYIQWEANRIISDELIRNLSLTFATIAVVSLLLIINLQVCLMVFMSVVFSVTNVCGYAHFLGLTIEIVTSICLILSVGLALDYAAHVGVIFSCMKTGTRQEKMQKTLGQIGPAVFNGGFSTFLAFILLAFSDSYVFLTFVKMFGMVVVFGLFHGLIFLPVLLSLIGPAGPPDEDSEFSIESPVVVSKEDGSNNRCNSPINSPDVEKR